MARNRHRRGRRGAADSDSHIFSDRLEDRRTENTAGCFGYTAHTKHRKLKDTGKATETPAQKVTENVTEKPAQPQTEAPKASYPSADEIGTSEYPTLADIQGFKWSSDKGAHWSVRTSTALELTDFDAVKGGWKAYLLDDLLTNERIIPRSVSPISE